MLISHVLKASALIAAMWIGTLSTSWAHPIVDILHPLNEEDHGDEGPPIYTGFGTAVAIRDTYALVGIPHLTQSSGRVAAYKRGTNNDWTRIATLTPRSGSSAGFGRSIAMRGNIAVIGGARSAYVFRRDNDRWQQLLRLVPASGDAASNFGTAVTYQDGIVVVGAPAAGAAGSVYVFRVDVNKGVVQSRVRLQAPDRVTDDAFGSSVAMTYDTIIAGAPESGGSNPAVRSGGAYVYKLVNSRWTYRQKLVTSHGEDEDDFGAAVAMDRGMIIVGAPGEDRVGMVFGDPVDYYAGGAAYVFAQAGSRYLEQQRLRPTEHPFFLEFGKGIAMFDKYVVITGHTAECEAYSCAPPGLAFTYTRSSNMILPRGTAHTDGSSNSLGIANNWLIIGSTQAHRCAGCASASIFDLNRLE